MSAKYTVIGGNGFIGGEIVNLLKENGENVNVPARDCEKIFNSDLGIVIFAAGNGDCVQRPFDVFNSNTRLLADILERAEFTQLVYISSTRVYMEQESSSEDANVTICNNDKRRLFNLTKLVSEELCLRSDKNTVIVRPSNVYGTAINSKLFLPSITRDAVNKKTVNMYVTPSYSKDYVSVKDVAEIIYKISLGCRQKIYNIASGINTAAQEIADLLQLYSHCNVVWHPGCRDDNFPITDISSIKDEFGFEPRNLSDDIYSMIISLKNC
ncbi:NAD-dependent epimerase/dehydratase family protein [Ewingella americana]|uniref:NAD-dependent epimerase/dehydratase family protein n=1 Tax=Ewingella americana TaxID=41202 RepID=UPI00163ADCE8|nr:SDR family oxidoreductase [Ewingella americana]QMV51952.1 SDR family oxidoreductase [Ewingella americana]